MTREPGADIPVVTQEMIQLYDDYTHISLGRRGFMANLSRLAGGSAAAAAAVLPLLAANAANAAIVAPDDPRLLAEEVTWSGDGGEIRGYIAKPANATGPLPGVVFMKTAD